MEEKEDIGYRTIKKANVLPIDLPSEISDDDLLGIKIEKIEGSPTEWLKTKMRNEKDLITEDELYSSGNDPEDELLNEEDLIMVRNALEEKHKEIKDEIESTVDMSEVVEKTYDEKRVRDIKNKINDMIRG